MKTPPNNDTVSNNFSRVPPKKYKSGSANNPPAQSNERKGHDKLKSKDMNQPLYKIKYINNSNALNHAQVASRPHMKPV